MFLPTSRKEVDKLGWDYIDVILFSGDAYIDHPSSGIAVIGRVLESQGYRVAIVPQPNWRDDLRDFKKLGEPRLFFGVSAGSMDSMVNHYTATKRLRSNDAYTPGGIPNQRPNYPTIVYTKILKELFPKTPVVIGSIEASLRRFTHYDYWKDELQTSILQQSNADLLIYGMGEKAITEIATQLNNGTPVKGVKNVPQTVYISKEKPSLPNAIFINSHEECLKSKRKYAENFRVIEEESNKWTAAHIIQEVEGKFLVANPPYEGSGLTQEEFDAVHNLPFTRKPHWRYNNKGAIPAYDMIKNSVNMHRGCFGGCSFCAISIHQGKHIASRSEESILKEVVEIAADPEFKGHITDLGGPSANMYKMQGRDLELCKKCARPSCLHPAKCKNLNDSHTPLSKLYDKASGIKGVKHLTIGSGLRLDLIQGAVGEKEYMRKLIGKHVSGRLKVAPEHTESHVLRNMRKPPFESFERFKIDFERINKEVGKNQQLIPYFISSHPGCTKDDMRNLSNKLKKLDLRPEQVQDFTPTPMTLSTVMYYTGINPYTMEPVYSAKTREQKDEQKSFFFWYKKPANKFGNSTKPNRKSDYSTKKRRFKK